MVVHRGEGALERAAEGFAAMGAGPRLEILQSLVRAGFGGLSVGELLEKTGLPPSTMAHHLRCLREAGLISQVKQGRSVMNHAEYDVLRGLSAYILAECCVDEDC